ncbi:MAG TPA: hypothetical protein VFB36_10080 [Nevskiaceae bacterium]|nr:hypothetical protein [Nevskiaceae bacterium]
MGVRQFPELATRYSAQHRAVWEFAARVDDWRCTVCLARIDYDDRELFEHTNLCPACSGAVNESLAWRTHVESER